MPGKLPSLLLLAAINTTKTTVATTYSNAATSAATLEVVNLRRTPGKNKVAIQQADDSDSVVPR